MGLRFSVKHLVFQGDVDAQNFTILNLDTSGLNLTKSSVGLGNVDNTSDVNKPVSTLQLVAISLKENAIAPGTTSQFLIGNKTWLNYGALATQGGETTLPILSSIAFGPALASSIAARRSDYGSTFAAVALQQYGTSYVGNILTGLPVAAAGVLNFQNSTYAVIMTNNAAPIVFGVSGTKRMRLAQGLAVGSDTDPGVGCISATGTITGLHLAGIGDGITGIVKEQIPTTLRVTTFPSLQVRGAGGAGFIDFSAQASTPATPFACIYANIAGEITLSQGEGFGGALNISGLTANRTFAFLNTSGTLPVLVAAPASAVAAGAAGSIAYDATHFYVAIAANSWVRGTLAAW